MKVMPVCPVSKLYQTHLKKFHFAFSASYRRKAHHIFYHKNLNFIYFLTFYHFYLFVKNQNRPYLLVTTIKNRNNLFLQKKKNQATNLTEKRVESLQLIFL